MIRSPAKADQTRRISVSKELDHLHLKPYDDAEDEPILYEREACMGMI